MDSALDAAIKMHQQGHPTAGGAVGIIFLIRMIIAIRDSWN